jgi:predicted HTH transcriptional regulator
VSRNPAVEAKAVEVPRPDATVSDHESGVAESHSEPDPADLSPRLRGLLSLIRERGRCTTQEHMANSGVSHRTALRDLQALVSQGFIERVGVRRGAWYRLSAGVADSASD